MHTLTLSALRLFVTALLLLPLSALPQPVRGAGFGAPGEHRVALVIGNAAYRSAPLRNPGNDARAMRDKLSALGFEVVYYENLKTREVGSALREFRNLIRPGSIALFFYAGHGLQIRGENYLPAVDATIESEEDVPQQSLSLQSVLNTMEDSKAGVNLVLLDACRNNPFARSFRSVSRGLARVQAPSGTLIHYATRPGSVAEDGEGANSAYTEALLAQIGEQGVAIEQALKRVTIRVRSVTKGRQEPWMEGSLTGDFYFILSGPTQITVQPAPATADAAAWQAAESIDSVAAYRAYLGEYPKGLYAAAARIKLASLDAPAPPAPPAAAGEDRDGERWREAQAGGSREYYEAYLQEFPKGRSAATARTELKRLARQEAEDKARAEKQAWDAARQANSEEALQAYLADYPSAPHAAEARATLKKLQAAAARQQALSAREQQRIADEQRKLALSRQVGSKAEQEALRTAAIRELGMARLNAGDFLMGAAADDVSDDAQIDEMTRPQHNVRVAAFELGYYEVTVGQFRKFVEATAYLTDAERPGRIGCQVPAKGGQFVLQAAANWRAPGFAQGDNHPVVCVSWNDVQAYLIWLNSGGEQFRLPSEAEWEYAARAGTTTPRPWSEVGGFFSRMWENTKSNGEDQRPPNRACRNANVADETLKTALDWPQTLNCKDGQTFTSAGASFGRNSFSLYDMIGNAAEWTQDCWNPNHLGAPSDGRARGGDCAQHVVRGGSWASPPAMIRATARQGLASSYRAADLGFRVARQPRQ